MVTEEEDIKHLQYIEKTESYDPFISVRLFYFYILRTFVALSILEIISYIILKHQIKNNTKMDIINNIIAPLIAGLIATFAGWTWGKVAAKFRITKKLLAAPQEYVYELDKLIKNAVFEGEENSIINARAIVVARNSLRDSLTSVSKCLNSEIDRLALEIGENIVEPIPSSRFDAKNIEINKETAFQTILVLAKVWPSKKIQIENEVRKIMSELKLDKLTL